MTIFSDKVFSQKIERAEARTNANFVEARARLFPAVGAQWIQVAGAYAMFDGVESPLTQTFGLGLFDEIGAAEMDAVEEFFRRHNAPIFHEVSPLADSSLINLLNERGYQPIELTSVMYRMLQDDAIAAPNDSRISTRIISDAEIDIFAETGGAGWSAEMPEFADFGVELCKVGAVSKGASPFIAELDGKPIATGMLFICEGVALLGGASTIPEGRRQGAQTALLAARLRFAAEQCGCATAIMGASPGSGSQRNAEKNGFRVAYTRTKWQLKK